MERIIKLIKEFCVLAVGSLLCGIGIGLFLSPNRLAPGGVSGISIILNSITHIETGSIIFMINIPLVLLGFWKLGFPMMLRTFFCVLLTSYFTNNALVWFGEYATDDKLISALAGGVLVGWSIGMIMKKGSTTGGTDIIVRILRKKYPHIKTSAIFAVMDIGIVAASAFVFKDLIVALYASIAVVTTNIVLDKVLYGSDEAKLVFIISDKSAEIVKRLLEDVDVGATYIKGKGAYSGTDKDIIMAVMRKVLAPKAEEVVKDVDPTAFMIFTSATEIYGQGYKNIFSEKL